MKRGCCSECGEGYDNEEGWLYNTECELCGHPIPENLIIKKENMDLTNLSDDQLLQELDKRKKIEDKKNIPIQIESPNFDGLIRTCQNYVDDVTSKGWANEDYNQYIFEEAMQAIFGLDVFSKLRKYDK